MRALVLGGGGPIGVAWEAGLLAGMADGGVDVSDADLIVGTSAGSIVGSQLAVGRTPREIYERQLAPEEPGRREQRNVDLSGVLGQFIKLYTSDRPAQELRAAHSLRDVDRLTVRMRVPGGPSARREAHAARVQA